MLEKMNEEKTFPKAAFRATIRSRRAARVEASDNRPGTAQAALTAHVTGLVHSQQPAAVVGYASLPGEPSLDEALEAVIAAGAPVFLPATRKGEPLLLGQVTEPLDDLPRGTWDIREPRAPHTAPEALARFATPAQLLVLVPGLAYDSRGVRLGNGGGFYDRTFGPLGVFAHGDHADLRAHMHLVGICWNDELTDALPREEWDLTVDAVLTEAGLHTVSSDT